MRLLHTADWHLGRTLEGRDRLEEQEQFLNEICEIVEREQIDAVLMAGDVFDTVNPPSRAEQLFYDSMARLSNNGKRPVIVIAGNHDNPDRLQASSPLARKQGITLIGYPTERVCSIVIPTAEEILKVAALPYPSEARLKKVLSEENEELKLRESYDAQIRYLFSEMSKSFTDESINIAMSHIFTAGGSATESERPIEVGGAYTVRATSLPERAQYTALGHLHRPQNIKHAKSPARYSGSPLAFSFSESSYTKSVTIVELSPPKAEKEIKIDEVYLSSGRPLVTWKARNGLQEVYNWLEEGRDKQAWIDLEVNVEHALSIEEIHRLRKQHRGIIHIRPIFPEMETDEESTKVQKLPIDEMFKRFYQRQTGGGMPEGELVQLFMELVHDEEEVK
ncbi:exonuclease SbcCD subunit D [Bacillus solimangrovi]|uniref:Nuclease SbcCD subunit D n=1 Tax=Bacillus solimangrovi TaxID=1305675 RepID=A0A1E5LC63_9BACI|nr:exonuclease SbcCD subunit D [Bacillus solimangrovi]OEH91676.1 exonuclease sbcCD subunit D [Bacillus solimangrovi]